MKSYALKAVILAVVATVLPETSSAQSFAGEIHSLQSVLDRLYSEMIPLCMQLIGVGQGLAGFAALWYISSRVWRHLANAEPIDFYPLLRPFALGLAILMFPSVLAVINGVLQPIVNGTAAMVRNSNASIAFLLAKREAEIKQTPEWQMLGGGGNYEEWYKYTNPTSEGSSGWLEDLGNEIKFAWAKASYGMKNMIKQWMSTVLQILYEAAALCINTIRTFYLIVLGILGPIVFGLAVFDGFQNTLIVWFARYINIFLWLPIANIFGAIIGKIQENMLRIDIEQINAYGETFFTSADTAYLIFMVISIIGYLTVPNVANYVVTVAGENVLLSKTSNLVTGIGGKTVSMAQDIPKGIASTPTVSEQTSAAVGYGYMHDKLSGK